MNHKKLASIGGKARAAKLTPERRRAIAMQANAARWAKKREQSETVKGYNESLDIPPQPEY